ncbi:MAG: hypothetical protein GY913_21125 [Proteobacteria bacterium]|nr:hypothetical protein [Pseudomonadota bacterium]
MLQLAFSGMAWATCSCPGGTGSPSDRLETYDTVFVGIKTGGRPCGCGSDLSHETRFVVTEGFKGVDEGDDVILFHDTKEDECGLRFQKNQSYLVYLNDGVVDLCDPGGPLIETEREVEDLRDLTE